MNILLILIIVFQFKQKRALSSVPGLYRHWPHEDPKALWNHVAVLGQVCAAYPTAVASPEELLSESPRLWETRSYTQVHRASYQRRDVVVFCFPGVCTTHPEWLQCDVSGIIVLSLPKWIIHNCLIVELSSYNPHICNGTDI